MDVWGVSVLIFQADVCPMPISVSPTHADFFPAEIAWPMRPDTLSSFVVYRKVNQVTSRPLGTYLNIERRVEAHLQLASLVLGKDSEETLLEDGGGETVGQDDDTIGGVW